MRSYIIISLVVILTTAADYALKYASLKPSPFTSIWFISGAALYGATAFGWTVLMKSQNLAQIAVLYSSATIIALSLVGIFAFGESLSNRQIVGLSAALLSVMLMTASA